MRKVLLIQAPLHSKLAIMNQKNLIDGEFSDFFLNQKKDTGYITDLGYIIYDRTCNLNKKAPLRVQDFKNNEEKTTSDGLYL